MTPSRAGGLLRFLRGLAPPRWAEDAPDTQLLQRFAAEHDEGAFAALVQRHGPMVLAVCRRALTDAQDAEDAFQAAFLVLARRARSIARPEILGNWLYGVACRTALEARRAARRRLRERRVADVRNDDPADAAAWADLRPLLDEEIRRLPEKYRAAFVLCHVQGHTNEEAARLLGCPKGTVLSRLASARERLRARLTRRGVTLSGGALLAVAGEAPAVPQALAGTTARAAALFAAGTVLLGQLVSTNVTILTRGVLTAMTLNKFRTTLLFVLLAGLLLVGGAVGFHAVSASQDERPPAAQAPPAPRERAPRLQEGAGQGAAANWIPSQTFNTIHASGSPRLTFAPGGKALFVASGEGISTLDLIAGKETRVQQGGRELPYRFIGVSPRGHLLAYQIIRPDPNQPARQVGIFDLSAGKELSRLDTGAIDAALLPALSPDGRTLALAHQNTLTLWDIPTGKRLGPLGDRTGAWIHALAFAPDGKRLAAGSGTGYPVDGQVNGAVTVWDVATRKLHEILPNPESQVNALAFSPDGKLLAGGGIHSRGLRVWDVDTGKEPGYFKHPDATQFFDVAFAPDGKTVAANWRARGSGNSEAGVAMWEVATGRLRTILKGQRGIVSGVAFAPDGCKLAAIDSGGRVQVWEAGPRANR